MARVYLDHNATMPLRPEARAAMITAMDVVGNPSSVHQEGRAAKALMERARGQIASAIGAEAADIVFVSGATEAAALALSGRNLKGAAIEHDAVRAWIREELEVDAQGQVHVTDPAEATLQLANSETGIIQSLPEGLAVSDWTQGFGKLPLAFDWSGVDMAFISAHKIGGPAGIGALVMQRGTDIAAQIKGGGQESGRRSGTENIIGLAGFGAAATLTNTGLISSSATAVVPIGVVPWVNWRTISSTSPFCSASATLIGSASKLATTSRGAGCCTGATGSVIIG